MKELTMNNRILNSITFTKTTIKPTLNESLLGRLFNSIFLPYLNFSEFEVINPQRIDEKTIKRLNLLWDRSHQYMRTNRMVLARKTLKAILRIDNNNAAAYNRLGICLLYTSPSPRDRQKSR